MHHYEGQRLPNGHATVLADGQPLPFDGHHSPTGLEWGYTGSGPAELARALLTHHLDGRARIRRSSTWCGGMSCQ